MVALLENVNSPELYLAGEGERVEIRAAAAFTTGYVDSDIIDISFAKNILLHITLNGDTITDSQLKIYFGIRAKLHELVHSQIDTGAGTLPFGNPTLIITVFEMGGSTMNISLPLINPGCSHMKCAVKANAASGNLALHVLRGQGNGSFPVTVVGT